MKRIFLLAGFFVSGYYIADAQSCAQTLRLARSTYEQGKLHELPLLLDKCLGENGFNTLPEKVDALKILTLAYIYLEEPEKADETMLKLLQTDHYFKINEAVDPAEFVALYRTFRTLPIYRIGGKFGAMATQPNVSSSNFANDGTSKYDSKIGVIAGATAEIPVFKHRFTLNPELYFQLRNFSFNNTHGIASTPSTEAQSIIALPVSLQYGLLKKQIEARKLLNKFAIEPYVGLGIQADYLLSSSLTISTSKTAELPIAEKTYDVKNQRNPLNISAIISGGAKLEAGPGYLILEARYYYGLTKLLNSKDVYANPFPVFDNYAVDGIFSLNSVSISVGYAYNIFNPKKLISK
ncbi:hypothetical protein BH10BAC4_BH10BAC4_25440 [soil metagenome]